MRILTIILLVLGWAALLGAANAALLASIQLAAIGLGLLVTAAVIAVLRGQAGTEKQR